MQLPEEFNGRVLISTDELAALAGRTRGWVAGLRAAGHLKAIQIGRKSVAFARHDVERLLTDGIPREGE